MSTYVTKHAKKHGLRIIDARTPLIIDVHKGDIAAATQRNSKECAFARACKKRAGVKAAFFFRGTAYIEYVGHLVRYLLPVSMQREIVSFDRAKVMDTGRYQLIPPRKSSRMGAVKKRSAKRPGRHQPAKSGIKRGIIHRSKSIRDLTEP